MGVFGGKQRTSLLPFPKSPDAHCAWGAPHSRLPIPTTLLPLPMGQRQGGGGKGGTLRFRSKLSRCQVVFVLLSFQLRLGLLCLLPVLVLVDVAVGSARRVRGVETDFIRGHHMHIGA